MRVAFGEYELDTETRTLLRDGRRIPVQSKAFDLLAYLIERRERLVSSDELLDALWPGLHVTPAALSTAVQKARQAVGDDGEHQTVIYTEHGKGFRFVAEVTDLSTAKADLSTAMVDLSAAKADRSTAKADLLAAESAQLVPVRSESGSVGLTPKPLIAELKRRNVFRAGAAYFAIIGLLALAAVIFAVDRFVFEAEPEPASGVPEKSIAVLPFDNISPDPEDTYFADGIHDEVLAQLSKIRSLKVISRTSVMRYSGKDRPSLPEIAANLGVANILEGSVRLAGNRVRITAQLIEAERGTHLWAQTYDREFTASNIFSIQSDVARAVTAELNATLLQEELDRLVVVQTQNLAAYEAYLLGKQELGKATTESLRRAVELFQRAVELDSGFALAYAALSESYGLLSELSDRPPEEMLAKARVAVDRALALDDRLGEAYNALAAIKEYGNDFEGAETSYRRALELNPNYATAYVWYGILLMNQDRPAEALPLVRKAVELDPLSPWAIGNLGRVLLELNRAEESRVWFQRAIEVDPSSDIGHFGLGFYRVFLGQLDEACLSFARSAALDPDSPNHHAQLGVTFLDLGDIEKADDRIRRSLQLGPELFWPNIAMSLLHVYRGDEAAALDHARKAYALWPRIRPAMSLLRDRELAVGRYAEARALYEEIDPGLLDDDPEVSGPNWRDAIDLALVLQKMGEMERASLLLQRSLEHLQTMPPRRMGAEIAEAQIYALRGDAKKALSALRQAVDQGWRSRWWYYLRHDPNLASLHGEPAYQAMVAEIEADMAAQRDRVREMERSGELEPNPEAAAE